MSWKVVREKFEVRSSYPCEHGDAEGNAKKHDKSNVVEAIVEVDAEAGEQADEESEHLPGPLEERHGQNGDDERRVRADKVGELETVVVEDAEGEKLLIARVIELKNKWKRLVRGAGKVRE